MTTHEAVGVLVQTAFAFYGGEGDAGVRVIRPKERMKIYISGKITDLDYEDAYELFNEAEEWILVNDHEPVNPMKSVGEVPGKAWIEYMVEDLAILNDCDGIFLLSNWQSSKGAQLEKAFCEITGKQIFFQETALPLIEVAA